MKKLVSSIYVYGIVSIAWVCISLWNWRLPGIQMDEVGFFSYIPGFFSQTAAALSDFRIPDNYFDVLDGTQQYPIFGYDIYFTQLPVYVASPINVALNYSFGSLRLAESLMGLMCLLSLVKLVTRCASALVALTCAALVITNPVFVIASRSQGWMFLNIMTLTLLSINLVLGARVTKKKSLEVIYVYAAGVLLAISSHIYFVGVFVAIPIFVWAIALLFEKKLTLLSMIFGMLTGFLPLIYGLISLWILQPSRLLHPFNPSASAAQASFETLSFQNVDRILELINGSLVKYSFAQGVSGPFTYLGSSALGLVLLLALVYSLIRYQSLRKSIAIEAKLTIDVILAGAALSLAGAFVLHLINFHHLIVFIVLFYIALVLMLHHTIRGKWIFALITSLIFLIQCGALKNFHTALVNSQGVGYHNVAWMAPGAGQKFCSDSETYVFVGWGAHLQYLFLTGGKENFVFQWKYDEKGLEKIVASQTRPIALIESTWNSHKPLGQTKVFDSFGSLLYAVDCIYPN